MTVTILFVCNTGILAAIICFAILHSFDCRNILWCLFYREITHRVINGKAGGYTTSWRVDVDMDRFGGLLGLQEE